MKMPIVSMNRMAMNESVATTCCYRKVPTATVLYWEVLHGGWVGNGFVEQALWRDSLGSGATWTRNVGLDFTTADGVGWDTVTEVAAKYEIVTISDVRRLWDIEAGEVYDNGDGGTSVQSGMRTILSDYITIQQDCSHTDLSTCKMKYLDQYYATDQHFESTSSHDVATGQSWNKAHDARQYSS